MEYELRIDTEQGTYIVASSKEFENILIKEPVKLITGNIFPGDKTTMHGWFTKPCEYVGMLASTKNVKEACFYLGPGTADLFSEAPHYYDLTIILGVDRIGKAYKPGTFRDSFLRRAQDGSVKWK